MASPRHESDEFFVSSAEALGEFGCDDGDDFVTGCGIGFHESQHGGVVDNRHARGLHGVNSCRRHARGIEQVYFAEERAWTEAREQDFFAVGVAPHLHHAVADEVEMPDGCTFLEDEFVGLNVVCLEDA